MDTTYKNILPIVTLFSDIPGPILERKDMHAIFQKKGEKGQNILKFGQKCTKFENILKKAVSYVQLSHTWNS